MAVSFTQDDDYIIPSHDGQTYLGLGGNDTYILSSSTIKDDSTIVISDTEGSNQIQLVGGLGIASSRVIGNAVELTLNNNAKVQILGASDFLYDVGGNATVGVSGTIEDFNTFVTNTLGHTESGSGENTNNDNADLLTEAQSKSTIISGIDNDNLVSLDNYIVTALYEGDSWLNFQGASDPVTYSFNETLPPEYTASGDTTGWQPLASNVRDVVDEIMSTANGVVLPDIEKDSGSGEIRFNMVETEAGTAAYAYFPGSGVGGDVFLGLDVGTDTDNGNVARYGAGRSTIVHELGHALGLTHSFEGASSLPTSEEHSANTVMSYTDFRMQVPQFTGTQTGSGSEVSVAYESVAPDHFMLYDIAALQAVYGPDTNYLASDTAYTFGTAPFYTTIWDAGGNDTLDFRGTAYYNVIDLTPGTHSNINYRDIDTQIADQQAVYRNQLGTSHYDDWVSDVFTGQSSDIYTGENALGIAWGTIIEKVTGGPAGNRITDNAVDNSLTGGTANDLFYLGAGGFDTVVGGGGYDLVILEQYAMDQVKIGSYEDSVLLAGDNFAVQMQGIAGIQFSDQLYTVV